MKHTLSILALSLLVCGTAYAAGKGAVEPAAGTLWKEDRTGMRFVWIPSGCFQMGGVGGTSIHKECVKGFWMGRYEVTQAQYQQIMGKNPSYFKGEDNPVEEVSWSEAKTFAEEMSLATGTNVALPSEVQWEYACRAGSQDEYCGGNSVGSVAWYTDNSDDKTHPVGQLQRNNWGLYDMSGNVREWVEDKYDNEHDWRVLRGGSWSGVPQFARAADRDFSGPASRRFSRGFRLARTLP